ncbi:glucosyltransferase domain-containing protein [Helicobacter sp. MIT 14-3879]|uniref:glucosyltransferase domain-containing protein n=1 Tax=Helicobacter sp. MIT 14-3879 TaxID=2040649 RepID=UPI000E1EBC20|nr:glucosyltransferase domain-containing protein [Helicobacter sp. MIT 14-3879]RDU64791.1 hypothetical protein CQA44_03515 [Helicobacter sp. MIT 14-3879]
MKILDSRLIFIVVLKKFFKQNKFNILFIFIFYLIALFSLILANFNYIDDLGRSIFGNFDFTNWDRYTSSTLAGILSLNSSFFLNLFPLSLLLSILFLSIASIILINTLNKELLNYKLAILSSLSIGLNPYYLQNLSYKFDSPFMALSVLSSIFPFLFLRYKKLFIITSFLSLLIMLTSYQASSGVYIIIGLFLAFKKLNQKAYKEAYYITLSCLISYLIASIIFKLFIHTPSLDYATSDILPPKLFIDGVYRNISLFLKAIYTDFGGSSFKASKVFLGIIFGFSIIFIFKNTLDSKLNKFNSIFLAITTLILLLILSYGLYIILIIPSYYARSFIGFGIFIALIVIDSISLNKKSLKIMSSIMIIILAQYLITFATYYGQSLRAHDDYQRFRYILVVNDLAKHLKESDKNLDSKFNIDFIGFAGATPNIKYAKEQYPIIKRLIPIIQGKANWGVAALEHYSISATTINCSTIIKYTKKPKILTNNYYHKIIRYEHRAKVCYIVDFKNI